MRLHLGPDVERPTIAADVRRDELAQLNQRTGFSDIQEQLHRQRNITVFESDETAQFRFLLRKIGRRPEHSLAKQLQTVLEAIMWFSFLEPAPGDTIQQLVVDPYPVPGDGRRGLSMRLRWPVTPAETVAAFATKTVRSISKDIGYDKTFGDPRKQDAGVLLDRYGNGVTITASAQGSASIETIGGDYDPADEDFYVTGHNIYNQRHVVVCLAGAIAIARADELLATP